MICRKLCAPQAEPPEHLGDLGFDLVASLADDNDFMKGRATRTEKGARCRASPFVSRAVSGTAICR